MTITREEFKELVELRKEVWSDFERLSQYYNEDVLSEVMFKVLGWIGLKLELQDNDEESDFDVLGELECFGKAAINIEEGEELKTTNNLDEIYNYYLAN